jgi:hypothetical protein
VKKIATRVAAMAAIALVLPATSSIWAEENWKSLKRESKRMKIDETAQEALNTLFATSPKAENLFEMSYGWAVFDNLKLTYMKMGTAGIGIGLGVNKYQVVFLFQDSRTFRNFVDNGWQADATASAVAGQAGAEAKTDFSNGMAIYQITDKGLMAHADIAGTKYWKNKKLNR